MISCPLRSLQELFEWAAVNFAVDSDVDVRSCTAFEPSVHSQHMLQNGTIQTVTQTLVPNILHTAQLKFTS